MNLWWNAYSSARQVSVELEKNGHSRRRCLLFRQSGGGATVKEKREVWAGSGMKTKEHMQRQDFRLVAWAALTHVALVLRYNLAFWLLWNGPLLPAELDFSVISAQRLEVCSHKSTCWRHCTYGPLRNKKFPHTGWFVLFILWAGPSADKLTDCTPGLYS